MNRTTLMITILLLGAATADAATFNQATYLTEADVDVLTRRVANEQIGRDLFGAPYATVVVGNVDVYDVFPYVEARYFQIVSDPAWHRLLIGEMGRTLAAYDGAGGAFGHLASPRGLSSDGLGHVYVADTGNDRVLVFRAISEFDRIELQPAYAIDGLSKPYDVAYSDGGTPFDASDDRLYVANTGRNEVVRYELGANAARRTQAIGALGSGPGYFAGPMAITVGHRAGVNSDDVYVADAHNGRLVMLRETGDGLAWSGAAPQTMGPITSLSTDHWGNVYAAAPQAGRVAKFTPSLVPVANLLNARRPRSFHVPFATVTDHRSGNKSRAGQGSGVLVEEWAGESGIRLMNLGVEVAGTSAKGSENAAASIMLTDNAHVLATITDPRSGRVVARHDAGTMAAGAQVLRFNNADYLSAWEAGEYRMTIEAASTYEKGEGSRIEIPVVLSNSGSPPLPSHLTSLGNTPNPFNPSTTIRFLVPAGADRPFQLRIYDVQGRLVRTLGSGAIAAGAHDAFWDGRDNRGNGVGSGIYLYRIEVGQEHFTGKLALVK